MQVGARVLVVLVVVQVVVVAGLDIGALHRYVRQIFPGSSSRCGAVNKCIKLKECPSLVSLLDHPTPDQLKTVQAALCGFTGREPKVCCPPEIEITTTTPTPETTTPTPETTTTTPLPQPGGEALLPEVCGIPGVANPRIFFGEDAPLGAYPWMALIGYTSSAQDEVVWGCGGSLITRSYVLTAAHCAAEEFTLSRAVSVVRLGEHDISTEVDCTTSDEGVRRCSPRHQDFTPEEIILHETFNTRGSVSDDIALIRLDRLVTLNKFVTPICLPTPDLDVGRFLLGRQGQVAGWGVTEEGPDTQVLQTVKIPYVSREVCNPLYRNGLLTEQICLGGDGRSDSCFGDSGGPVVATTPPTGSFYTLLALVSFGQPTCGVPGVPAVYTNIASYRQWILDNLRP